ncbi:hypothetical protein [Pseudomonas mohnii]
MAERKAKAAGSQKSGSERQADLKLFTAGNSWLATLYAKHTFEVDFVAAGNHEAVVKTVPKVYTDTKTIDQAKEELQSGQLTQMGSRVLTMAKQEGKGWFAILLAEYLTPQVQIPAYILQAIHFAHGPFPRPLLARVLQYRAECRFGSAPLLASQKDAFRLELERFEREEIGLLALKAAVDFMLPGDAIKAFLAETA